MILVIDNYDSFSYNLVQMAGTIDSNIKIIRNDEKSRRNNCMILPCYYFIRRAIPRYRYLQRVVENMMKQVPILGIGLGHQVICEFSVLQSYLQKSNARKKSSIHIANGNAIFKGLPPIQRYTSRQVARTSLPIHF